MQHSPPILGLAALAPSCDAVFSDVWGVVHDGARAIPSACEALARIRAAGKPVLLVSNAPRPAPIVIELLDSLGVPRAAYDGVLTSGDLTRAYLAEKPRGAVHHIGPERDRPIFEGLELTFAGPEAAERVVATGLVDDERETAEDYRPLLERLVARALPLACANPDLVVERGERLIPCAGALAALYETLGGKVLYFGKPHAPVYAAALRRLEALAGRALAPARVLAIGDAIRTDLLGAAKAGMPALFVAGGIHAAEAGAPDNIATDRLAGLFRAAGVDPIGIAWRLAW